MTRRLRLRGRLLISYLLVIGFGLSAFVVRYGWIRQDSLVEEVEHEQVARALVVSRALVATMHQYVSGASSQEALTGLVDRLAASVGARLTLLDGRGNPVYDTEQDATALPSQWQQVEVQTALAGDEEHGIRLDPVTGQERLYVAGPIADATGVLGIVQVDLSGLLRQAVASFEPRAQAAGITLSLDAAPDVPPMAASPAHIRQVVDNLLDNALKYSAAGGVIAVACRILPGRSGSFSGSSESSLRGASSRNHKRCRQMK